MPPRRAVGTFLKYKALGVLPGLLREWRALEQRLAPLRALERELQGALADEKAVRGQIAEAFLAADIPRNLAITCNGYEVIRRERKGAEAYNPATITSFLIRKGVAAGLAAEALEAGHETEPPSVWVVIEIPPATTIRRPRG